MNAYTTRGQARIQHRDISTALQTHRFVAPAALAALERQRGLQAEVELDWLLHRSGVKPTSVAARVTPLRMAIGAALVRVGQRVQGASQSNGAPDTTVTPGTLSVAG